MSEQELQALRLRIDNLDERILELISDRARCAEEVARVKMKELAAECRSGSISPDKLTGASFTVSNLGAFGVTTFTPIINPPQTGILGVCNIETRIRMKNGQPEFYPTMNLSLTYDHRALDGAPASRFLQALANNIANFDLLLAK